MKPLRVLLLEDVESDALLVEHELSKLRRPLTTVRTETREDFTQALQEFGPDIILADYSLPAFDGMSALLIAQEKLPVAPFLFVSGAIGEERAIEALKSGAIDYVLKDHLERLAPSVERALREANAQLALRQSEALLRKVMDTLPVGVFIADREGRIISANPAGQEIWAGVRFVGPDGYGEYCAWWADTGKQITAEEWGLARALSKGETSAGEEIEIVTFEGVRKVILNWAAPLCDESGEIFAAIALNEDITERKRADRQLALNSMRLEMLHNIDRAVLAARSAAEIAEVTVHGLRQLVPCQRAAVVLFDFEREEAQRLAVDADGETALPSGTQAPLEAYFSPGQNGTEFLVDDLTLVSEPSALTEMLINEGLRSYLSVPLMVEGRLIGNVNLSAQLRHAFTADALDIVRHVADSLAVAIQNARLNQQVQHDRLQLQELSRRLVEVQENERRAIARELHDEAGQALTSLVVGLSLLERETGCSEQMVERIDQLKQTTKGVMEDLHRLAVNLRPASLDRAGLVPTLRQYAESFGDRHELDVQFEVLGLDEERLPSMVQIALYRIVQEALTNVARHAQAKHVGIILERREDRVLAIVEDDGVGFDPRDARAGGRLGLFGMRERAEMLGGTLVIESARGAGATVFAEVPVSLGGAIDSPNSDRG